MANILNHGKYREFPEGDVGYINAQIRKTLAELATQEPINPDRLTQDQSTQGEQS